MGLSQCVEYLIKNMGQHFFKNFFLNNDEKIS